jgi:hypothetical protein
LTKQIETKLAAIPKRQDELIVAQAYILLTEIAYYNKDSNEENQKDTTFGIRISTLKFLTLPYMIDDLSVIERLDWAFIQFDQNHYHFPHQNVAIDDDGWRVFDPNGTDVTKKYCLVDGNSYHAAKGRNAYLADGDFGVYEVYIDNNCNFHTL